MSAVDPDHDQRMERAHWRVEGRIAKAVAGIATFLTCLISLVGPVGYFVLSWQSHGREAEVAVRLYANKATQMLAIAAGDGDAPWQLRAAGLLDVDLVPSLLPEHRMLLEPDGHRLAAAFGQDGRWPIGHSATFELVRRAPVLVNGRPVAELVIVRDLAPIVRQTMFVLLGSSAMALLLYLLCAVVPMRILRRTLEALKFKAAVGRREAEAHLKIVFDNAIEGILTFSADGNVKTTNPAAARIFGRAAADELAGLPMGALMRPLAAGSGQDAFPVGSAETEARRGDGSRFPVDITISESRAAGVGFRIAIIRDITERKQAEARLSQLANFDSLTGLPNRSRFRERLQQAMFHADTSGQAFTLMFLDLDRFKTINDSLGHDVGDRLLQRVAQALADCVADETGRVGARAGVVSRLGGDEFTVLIEGLPRPGDAPRIAGRILAALAVPFAVGKDELYVSASIGITHYPQPDCELDSLVKQADIAMYRSKERGRNTFYVYNDELDIAVTERLTMENALRHALERGEFRLQYQPKVALGSGQLMGVETLLRWVPESGEPVGPDRFVPILEDTGLIIPIGTWVLRQACQQMVRWIEAGLEPMELAVNLSARQFRQGDLIEMITGILEQTGLPPQLLEIELTESMLVEDIDEVERIMRRLGAMGISIAIDDFGTGHSSLSYLKRFDLDTLKIDRSFVRDTPDDPEDSAITTAIIAMAHCLGLRVVAEGVENRQQADFLKAQGCDQIQGYLLSPPMAADEAFDWLRRYRPLGASRRAAVPVA